MFNDCRGLPLTTVSEAAVAAFDHAIDGYLGYKVNMTARMEALLAADPDFGLAHTLKGYLLLMGFRADTIAAARSALAAARRCPGTAREKAHEAALGYWIEGGTDQALAVWTQILERYPHDILAFRLVQFVNFWCGRPEAMLASVLSIGPQWTDSVPGYNAMLASQCFAQEETGHYREAEATGRAVISRDPTDLWAAHGVAHVLEMTGRHREGITWIESLQLRWDCTNNLKHHLWWHQAMYHLELGDFDKVLALYDTGFRNLRSPMSGLVSDLFIDVQNAASMLFRLGRQGLSPGDRWTELADKAEARIGDCQSAFTLPHWMMALAATGREAASTALLAAMQDYASGDSSNARLVRDVALPVTRAVLANGQGRDMKAVTLMRPVLGEMYRLGGSHAQQEVLEQVFLDSALKAEAEADIALLLKRVAARHPIAPEHRRGYAMALRVDHCAI
jgi:tetratricopeptide (TPR) repeat protein